ncbi:MAG: class I SAM-dependent methyltransferase [Candidatus Hodarchaeota archaeon]
MNSQLLSGGKHYDLLINWEKRLVLEVPFLRRYITGVKPQIKTILEVGCATGRHTQILQQMEELQVTGIDIDESMIDEAKKRVPKAEFIVQDFLDLKNRKFDSIISLGNSVGLIAQSADYYSIIERFSQLLRRSNGLLIFQLLNTEIEREGWSSPRSITTADGEFIFLRGFTTTAKCIHPEILTLYKSNNEAKWEIQTSGRANIPRISHQEMIKLLNQFEFREIRVFGSYHEEVFDPDNSVDMIFVCHT